MEFTYTLNRKDYKKFLKNQQDKVSLAFLIIYSIIYFIFACIYILEYFKVIITIYILSFIFIFIIFKLFNLLYIYIDLKLNDKITDKAYGLYHITIDDKKIISEVNNHKFIVKFDDIKKIRKNKNSFIVYPKKSKIMFFIIKDLCAKETYEDVTKYINEIYNKKKNY